LIKTNLFLLIYKAVSVPSQIYERRGGQTKGTEFTPERPLGPFCLF